MRFLLTLLLASLGFSHSAQAQAPDVPCRAALEALSEGENAEVIAALEVCLDTEELTPGQEVLAYAELGAALLEAQRYEDALAAHAMAEAIAETQDFEILHPSFYRNRGIALSETGDNERAIQDLLRADRAQPDEPLTLVSLGFAYRALDLDAEAVEVFDRLVRATPDWSGAWINRSSAFLDLGMTEAAVADAERAVEIEPDSGSTLNMLCWTLIQDNRAQTALPLCEQAVEADPEIGAFVHSLATALEATGEARRARRLFSRAYSLSPDDPEIAADYERTRNP